MLSVGPPPAGGLGWSIEANSDSRGQPVRTRGRRVLDVVQVHERDHGEHHEDQRRAERPAELERRVSADLDGLGAAAARAVAHERPDQRALDDQEDHDRHVERDLVERVDVVGLRRSTRFRGEGVGQRAGRGDQKCEQGRREGGEQHETCTAPGQGAAHHIPGPDKRSTSWRLPRCGRQAASQAGRAAPRTAAAGRSPSTSSSPHAEPAHLELLDPQVPDHRALDRQPPQGERPDGRGAGGHGPDRARSGGRGPLAEAPVAGPALREPAPHAPWNSGSRFCTNAVTPSWKSRVRARACWSSASRSSWPSRSG